MAYTIKIDLKSQTPVYKQLINSVETAIHNGEYRYGDLLPSMNELSLQLGISKETVKKAYSLMPRRERAFTFHPKTAGKIPRYWCCSIN